MQSAVLAAVGMSVYCLCITCWRCAKVMQTGVTESSTEAPVNLLWAVWDSSRNLKGFTWSKCVKWQWGRESLQFSAFKSLNWCKTGSRLLLMTNTKLYVHFWLVLKSVTLNDLEQPLQAVALYIRDANLAIMRSQHILHIVQKSAYCIFSRTLFPNSHMEICEDLHIFAYLHVFGAYCDKLCIVLCIFCIWTKHIFHEKNIISHWLVAEACIVGMQTCHE